MPTVSVTSSTDSTSSPVVASWDKGLNYGPLTTKFTPEASCSVPVALSDNNGPTFLPPTAYLLAVSCSAGDANYDSACWPPPISNYDPFSFRTDGFYSPGYICPQGYTSACSQTPGAFSGHPGDPGDFSFQYQPTGAEHAVGCCLS